MNIIVIRKTFISIYCSFVTSNWSFTNCLTTVVTVGCARLGDRWDGMVGVGIGRGVNERGQVE